jgi:hypothetical protein
VALLRDAAVQEAARRRCRRIVDTCFLMLRSYVDIEITDRQNVYIRIVNSSMYIDNHFNLPWLECKLSYNNSVRSVRQGWSYPRGVKIFPRGEDPLFAPSFLLSLEIVHPCWWTKGWTIPLGIPLGTKFTPGDLWIRFTPGDQFHPYKLWI